MFSSQVTPSEIETECYQTNKNEWSFCKGSKPEMTSTPGEYGIS